MSRLTSSFTCHLISVIITTLIIHHSFTLSLQAQNLPFKQILPTLVLLLPWTAFTITRPDRTYHASRIIFSSFLFNFSVCPVQAMVGVDTGSLYRRTHSLSCLAWSWVGGRLAPFYIHQMNRVNSRNGYAMMTAP